MARPRKEIDPEQVEKLAAINCSVEKFADFFDVDPRMKTTEKQPNGQKKNWKNFSYNYERRTLG